MRMPENNLIKYQKMKEISIRYNVKRTKKKVKSK